MKKIILPAVGMLALCLPAMAEPGGHHGRGHGAGPAGPGAAREERGSDSGAPDLGAIIISAAERALIGEYYRSHPAPVDALPPGIQKKVARGKPLPPGIAKRFPDGLRARLPARPGYDYRTVGADVLLVEAATGIVVDIVRDILR